MIDSERGCITSSGWSPWWTQRETSRYRSLRKALIVVSDMNRLGTVSDELDGGSKFLFDPGDPFTL